MKRSVTHRIRSYLQNVNRWFHQTPERALDQAYEAALAIQAIENEHFSGGAITPNADQLSRTVAAYFQRELQKCLSLIRLRLSEFQLSQTIVGSGRSQGRAIALTSLDHRSASGMAQSISPMAIEKLKLIDDVLGRYASTVQDRSPISRNEVERAQLDIISFTNRGQSTSPNLVDRVETLTDATGVLPRSILGVFNRIQRQLDPKAEEKFVQSFRNSKTKTLVALKLLSLLIVVPILTQQIAKDWVIEPLLDRIWINPTPIFLNSSWRKEALEELQEFEEELKFDQLIGIVPMITPTELEGRLKDKAEEIASKFRQVGNGAIKNVFADLLALTAFVGLLLTHRRELTILKSFLDDLVYGLNDSAKAFIIILFTDTFVGYHSPEGWEVLLKGVAQHFGLPESETFIYLFIATVPVGMATVFKFWIFRYLNSISPSAVATYKEMNE